MSKQLIENLEERRLLSAVLSGGTLTVTGTGGADAIAITKTATMLVSKVNKEVRSFKLTAVARVVVNALGGNDVVNVAADVTKPVKARGDAGNDTLVGGGGPDELFGGDGNDLVRGNGGGDTLGGGPGVDTADYAGKTVPLTIDLDNVADDGAAGEKDNVFSDVEDVRGGSAKDSITGDADDNHLEGGGGDDAIVGGGGDDDLDGQGGNDDLDGNAGDDDLDGGEGNDDLDGGEGSNVVRGGTGRDRFRHTGGEDGLPDQAGDEVEDDTGDADTAPGETDGVRLVAQVNVAAGTVLLAPPSPEAGAAAKSFALGAAATVTVDGRSAGLAAVAGLRVYVVFNAPAAAGVAPTIKSIAAVGAKVDGRVSAFVAPTDAAAGSITLKGGEGRADRVFALAAGVAVKKGDVAGTAADVKVGSDVLLSLSAQSPNPVVAINVRAAEGGGGEGGGGDDGTESHGGPGTVVSVDAAGSKITLAVRAGDATKNTVFTVTAATEIKLDGVVTPLAGLPAGLKVEFHTTEANPTVLTGIVAEGALVKGKVTAVAVAPAGGPTLGTVTLQGAEGAAGVTYALRAAAPVKLNGVVTTLAQVPVGANIELKLGALDGTVVRASASASTGGGDDGGGGTPEAPKTDGPVTAVNADARTITLQGGEGAANRTFTLAAGATVTVDGKPAPLGSLGAGVKVVMTLTTTEPRLVTAVVAAGPTLGGRVFSVDAAANTITLRREEGVAGPTYNVAADAKVTKGGATVTLASLLAGSEVKLTLSALSDTTAVGVAG